MPTLKQIATGFTEERALALLDGLQNGDSIDAPESEDWDFHQLLFLAGACLYQASHRPEFRDAGNGEDRTGKIMAAVKAYGLLVAGVDQGLPASSTEEYQMEDVEE